MPLPTDLAKYVNEQKLVISSLSEQKIQEKLEKATKFYEENKDTAAFREMEDLVEYTVLDQDTFDRLALLDIVMLFINQLMKSGRNEQALGLLRKVVEARN